VAPEDRRQPAGPRAEVLGVHDRNRELRRQLPENLAGRGDTAGGRDDRDDVHRVGAFAGCRRGHCPSMTPTGRDRSAAGTQEPPPGDRLAGGAEPGLGGEANRENAMPDPDRRHV
jgi:hypothetical protein